MEEKLYTITLADGTVLSGLRMNGNNYISGDLITENMFTDNCTPVIISDGETYETHDYMVLTHLQYNNEKYWFGLRDRTPGELAMLKMQSDILFLSMMTGVDL